MVILTPMRICCDYDSITKICRTLPGYATLKQDNDLLPHGGGGPSKTVEIKIQRVISLTAWKVDL